MSEARFTTLIEAEALVRLVETAEVMLFDCRFDLADPAAGRRAYADGHIAGAVHLSLDDDLSGRPTGQDGRHPLPDRRWFAGRLASLGLRQGQQVVGYDASGGIYAARLWWMLRWLGHADVAVLDGGMEAWTAAGHALTQGEPVLTPGDFEAVEGVEPVVVGEVMSNLTRREWQIVDARSPHRFHGGADPLDAVAGHIPGAVNRFFRDNLDSAGRFKSPQALRQEWDRVAGSVPPEEMVHQCGSGVTAAHNLLAMDVAGLTGSRLYPGSWSEWISNPSRPIDRGDGAAQISESSATKS